MSTSDGYVVGATKIVDHGPDSARWNLVIVGDGYRDTELANYHTHAQSFVTALRGTPPFNTLFCGINVYRIDVVSNQSGADDPGCAGGPAVTANTYFDATFCSLFAGTPMDRLLTINSGVALSVATTHVPQRHQVLCIVNSTKYGGSGGAVATCSVDPQANEIAIHEIGHSAFGLADEYGGNGAGTPAGEPAQPNVTRDTNRATNKWRALIAATTPMPSACDPTCAASTCVPPGAPPAAGAVGTYEGGIYSDCNTYRPLPSCYMRDYSPFCPVCSGVITQVLAPFQPAESINLVTPSISFTNVPAGMGGVGVTTHRAIRWDVVTCRTLTFMITAGPTGGFGTPFGIQTSVGADPNVPAAAARIWLSYTSTNPGDSANGSVTVRCIETGQSWVININANTIARRRTAVSLVLDRSGSMTDDAGDGINKVTKLREAARVFIDTMLPDDGIGLVRFNEAAQRIMEVMEAGVAPGGTGRTTAINNHINTAEIDPAGATSIGDGVVNGRNMLNDAQAAPTPDYDGTAMVILTDGMWNTPPSLASVAGSINAQTYAVGFGLPSNISVPALTTLCQGNNGYLLVTGALTADQSMRLSKYFLQILAGVSNAQIVADPAGVLDINAEHRIPFWICAADFGMDLILLSPYPYAIDFRLEAPDGTLIDPATAGNLQFVSTDKVAYYRCALPVLPGDPAGTHVGQWHAVLRITRKYQGGYRYAAATQRLRVPYEFVAHAYSALTFAAQLTQASYEIGAVAAISAALLEYDQPPRGRATVWAEVQKPDGGPDIVMMPLGNSGRYEAAFPMAVSGVYTFRIRARGETVDGEPFEREQTLTGVAVAGGDHWSPDDPKRDPLCELLDCLRRTGAIDGEFAKRLQALGFDLPALLKCLGRKCRKPSEGGRAIPGVPTNPSLSHYSVAELAEALSLAVRGKGADPDGA
ncbi:MAG: VWA domain-containing protein [Rhodospirillaceae bacterium]|nr:VWA domain-containing protein [Rhodospirillaceae bacterium]